MMPDIIAKIKLYRTEDGGRQGTTPSNKFGCLFVINGEYFDCRLLLQNTGSLSPGQSAIVPIVFLSPDLVKSLLNVKQSFHLWDGKIIADGEVLEIITEKQCNQ